MSAMTKNLDMEHLPYMNCKHAWTFPQLSAYNIKNKYFKHKFKEVIIIIPSGLSSYSRRPIHFFDRCRFPVFLQDV